MTNRPADASPLYQRYPSRTVVYLVKQGIDSYLQPIPPGMKGTCWGTNRAYAWRMGRRGAHKTAKRLSSATWGKAVVVKLTVISR